MISGPDELKRQAVGSREEADSRRNLAVLQRLQNNISILQAPVPKEVDLPKNRRSDRTFSVLDLKNPDQHIHIVLGETRDISPFIEEEGFSPGFEMLVVFGKKAPKSHAKVLNLPGDILPKISHVFYIEPDEGYILRFDKEGRFKTIVRAHIEGKQLPQEIENPNIKFLLNKVIMEPLAKALGVASAEKSHGARV